MRITNYLNDLLPLVNDKGLVLRSSKVPLLLEDSRTHHITYGDQSFGAATSREWSNLSSKISHH